MTCFFVKYSVIFEKAPFRNFDNLSNVLRLNCVNLIPNYTLWEAKLTQKVEKQTLPTLLLVVTHMNFNILSYYYFFTSSFMCVWWFYCIILPVLKNKVTIFALECKKNRGDTCMAFGQYKKAKRLNLNSYSPQCNAVLLVLFFLFPDTSV